MSYLGVAATAMPVESLCGAGAPVRARRAEPASPSIATRGLRGQRFSSIFDRGARATFVDLASRMSSVEVFVSQGAAPMLDSLRLVLIVSQGVAAPERSHARVAADLAAAIRSGLANQEIRP
jgi:hypothetical protein